MSEKIDVPRALDTVALLSQFGNASAKNLADYTTALVEALEHAMTLLNRESEELEKWGAYLEWCHATRALLPSKSEGEENESA